MWVGVGAGWVGVGRWARKARAPSVGLGGLGVAHASAIVWARACQRVAHRGRVEAGNEEGKREEGDVKGGWGLLVVSWISLCAMVNE